MSKELEELKREIRAVLTGFKAGIKEENFSKEYKSLCSKALPYHNFHFANVPDLIKSLPDVVQIRKVGGVNFYFEKPNEETKHITDLVRGQKGKSFPKVNVPVPVKSRYEKRISLERDRNRIIDLIYKSGNGIKEDALLRIFRQDFKCNFEQHGFKTFHAFLKSIPSKSLFVEKVNGEVRYFHSKSVHARRMSSSGSSSKVKKNLPLFEVETNESFSKGETRPSSPSVLRSDITELLNEEQSIADSLSNSEKSTTIAFSSKINQIPITLNAKKSAYDPSVERTHLLFDYSILVNEVERIVQKYPSGLIIEEFPVEYCAEYGKSLKVSEHGFSNIYEFFWYFSSVFKMVPVGFLWMICPMSVVPDIEILYIKPKKFPENREDFIKVVISAVVNPGEFYVHIYDSLEECGKLVNIINSIYIIKDEALVMHKFEIKQGSLVMAYDNLLKLWMRAEVIGRCGPDKFSVFYLDLGVFSSDLSVGSIRRPTEAVLGFHRQAILACAEGIRPKNPRNGWCKGSIKIFTRMARGKRMAKLIRGSEYGIPELLLMDEPNYMAGTCFTINHSLVSNELAVSLSADGSMPPAESIEETNLSEDRVSCIELRKLQFTKGREIHVISYEVYRDKGLLATSNEISNLIRSWKGRDLLSVMLANQGIPFDSVLVHRDECKKFFDYCEECKVLGFEGDEVTLYPTYHLLTIIRMFGTDEERSLVPSITRMLQYYDNEPRKFFQTYDAAPNRDFNLIL